MKKSEIAITEKKTRKTGLVVYSLWPIIEGNLKSDVLGGTNPGPLARWPVICTSRTHLSPTLADIGSNIGYGLRRLNLIRKRGKTKTKNRTTQVNKVCYSRPNLSQTR